MAATDPDQIARAFLATLTPGGVPVGGIGAVTVRTPDVPYIGPTPIVQVRPSQNVNAHPIAAGRVALGYMDQGYMDLIYRDSPPSQQTGKTLSQIEDAMWAARNAIVAALRASPTLGGDVTIASESIEETYNPEGPFDLWQGAEFVGFVLRATYQGPLQ